MCVCGYLVPFKSKLKYTFTGNEKDRSGYAEGSVEIVPIDGVKSDAIYELYWGDDRGVFKDYYSLGIGKGQGDSLTISIGENIMIPCRATKIYAAENKKAIAAIDIPAEKRYNKTPELVSKTSTRLALTPVYLPYINRISGVNGYFGAKTLRFTAIRKCLSGTPFKARKCR